MIVKVCGLKYKENAEAIANAAIDMVGFNFYKPSSRYIAPRLAAEIETPKHIKRVGVFVDEDIALIKDIGETARLDIIQLHGQESQEIVDELAHTYQVIKVVGVEASEDLGQVSKWTNCKYILLDKKSPIHGGTGKKFDWSYLKKYNSPIPFLLAGGIGPNDAEQLLEVNNPKFAGVDINSLFEDEPGFKNLDLVTDFIEKVKPLTI